VRGPQRGEELGGLLQVRLHVASAELDRLTGQLEALVGLVLAGQADRQVDLRLGLVRRRLQGRRGCLVSSAGGPDGSGEVRGVGLLAAHVRRSSP